VRVFKNAWFRKFARKQKIEDPVLCEAVARAEAGLIDADLGGGLIKQRVAREGAGKSGGYRTLVMFKAGTRAVFAFGFAKNDRGNIDAAEEAELKKAAKLTLGFSEEDMNKLVSLGQLIEVKCNDGEAT
jgi:hypothetical protein